MDNTKVTIHHLISQAGWSGCNLSIYPSILVPMHFLGLPGKVSYLNTFPGLVVYSPSPSLHLSLSLSLGVVASRLSPSSQPHAAGTGVYFFFFLFLLLVLLGRVEHCASGVRASSRNSERLSLRGTHTECPACANTYVSITVEA